MAKKKAVKSGVTAGSVFFHFFFGAVTVVGGLLLVFGVGLRLLPMILAGGALTLLGFGQMTLYSIKKQAKEKGYELPSYRLGLWVAFAVIMIIIARAGMTIGGGLSGSLDDQGKLMTYVQVAVALFAVLILWGMCSNLAIFGTKLYVDAFRRFARDFLGVFLVYQLSLALLSFLCNAVVLLFGGALGTEDVSLAVKGFFALVSESDGGGLRNLGMEAVAGLTAASSYFVLSTMAQESLEKDAARKEALEKGEQPVAEEALTLRKKVERLLFDSDTKKLLVMTVLCLVASVFSGVADGRTGKIFVLVCIAVWVVSAFLFIKETGVLWYAANYAVMSMVQLAVPIPAVTGVIPALLAVVLLAVRIVLFTAVALLIGMDHYQKALRAKVVAEHPEEAKVTDKVNEKAYGASILEAGIKAADVVIHRKEYARNAGEKLKKKAKEKLMGK